MYILKIVSVFLLKFFVFVFFFWIFLVTLRKQKAYVIHWVRLDRFASVEEAFNDGMMRLETLVSRVHDIVP